MGESRQQTGVRGFRGSGRISGLGSTWSFLACQVFLGEALLARLAFPIVITHAPSVDDNPAAELAKHRPGGDNSDLARSVRVRKDILLDQIILLDLRRDDLMKRPILVEKEI